MYQEIIKPFAIYLNGQLHSRYRHYSTAEGVAYAMARQWPSHQVGVWWDCAGVQTMFIEYGANCAAGVNHNVAEN
ncbi:MAG: hypothetical protein SAJ12_08975 [Jaaginema sp. PMC 1079.18]|nr:hypothetical protein [Jaaginema sp. PMC 1080.18]MEC4851133.1 hypothetical protein [Jaaginema sp. PMC 1079.18]MEC4866373.1 hypothetical protein [Jaaginema sp. PMC 1078.18]